LHHFRVLAGIRPSRLSHEEARTGITEHVWRARYLAEAGPVSIKLESRCLSEGVGAYYVQKLRDSELYFKWMETQKNGNPKGLQVVWDMAKKNPDKGKKTSVPSDLISRLWKLIGEKDLPKEVKARFSDAG